MIKLIKSQIKFIYGSGKHYSPANYFNLPRKRQRLEKKYKALERELSDFGIVLSYKVSKLKTNQLRAKFLRVKYNQVNNP